MSNPATYTPSNEQTSAATSAYEQILTVLNFAAAYSLLSKSTLKKYVYDTDIQVEVRNATYEYIAASADVQILIIPTTALTAAASSIFTFMPSENNESVKVFLTAYSIKYIIKEDSASFP